MSNDRKQRDEDVEYQNQHIHPFSSNHIELILTHIFNNWFLIYVISLLLCKNYDKF